MSEHVPPLPSAVVDFNVLHDQLAAGDDPRIAAEKAIAAGAGEPFPEYPSLSGKSKADLLKIADDEGAGVDDTMTNAAIADAIDANRSSGPLTD